jgi:hypothetical protein
MGRDSRLNPCAIYRIFNDAGDLLYLGIASNALQRAGAHGATSWFRSASRIELQWFPHRNAAETAERAAIAAEKPRHNKQHNGCKLPALVPEKPPPTPAPRKPHNVSEFIRGLSPAVRPMWRRLYAAEIAAESLPVPQSKRRRRRFDWSNVGL